MIQNRFKKYLLLLIGSIVVPYMATIVIIMITGDRISGMKYFAIPTVLLIHFTFALTQLKLTILKRILLGAIAAVISSAITLIPLYLDFKLNIDMYGFWDIIVFHTIGTIGAWELLNQLVNLITKYRQRHQA